jgi:hypothetical protein
MNEKTNISHKISKNLFLRLGYISLDVMADVRSLHTHVRSLCEVELLKLDLHRSAKNIRVTSNFCVLEGWNQVSSALRVHKY